MKKIIGVIFTTIICLGILSGCGSNETEIKEELRGEWSYDYYAVYVDEHCTQTYKFDGDGNVESSWINIESPSKSKYHEGTYEIKEKTIEIEYNDGSEGTTIEYSYNNGNLKLFEKGTDGSLEEELKKK